MPRHLRNTLILPDSDARLAARLLSDAIDALDVLLMLVFGKDKDAEQIVEWADQLCDKTSVSDTFNFRQVVWIRDASSQSMGDVLGPLIGTQPYPLVAALNFHDQVRDVARTGDVIDPIRLEVMFLRAGLLEEPA